LACDDDDGGTSAQIADNLRACDLISAGSVRPDLGGGEIAECVERCYADATCEELDAFLCDQRTSDRLGDCQAQCARPGCDGGETRYTLLQRCDGEAQCDDGADERNCPEPLYCKDSGARVGFLERCNGREDCEDGSDEQDCPEMFTCETKVAGFAQQVPASKLCNLANDCLDGSDESEEQGCAQLTCN
jgi:hypothetical protein